jgi:hypothetical protein
MGDFVVAVVAGICVSIWNKFLLLNGGWRACLIEEHKEEIEHADDCSTTSTITLNVHTH